MSIIFNKICINEEMLPKYTYMYIYIYLRHKKCETKKLWKSTVAITSLYISTFVPYIQVENFYFYYAVL